MPSPANGFFHFFGWNNANGWEKTGFIFPGFALRSRKSNPRAMEKTIQRLGAIDRADRRQRKNP
jgi:hypothetical protein